MAKAGSNVTVRISEAASACLLALNVQVSRKLARRNQNRFNRNVRASFAPNVCSAVTSITRAAMPQSVILSRIDTAGMPYLTNP
jgi:hypothetical protein